MDNNTPTIIRTDRAAIMTMAPRGIDRLDAQRIVDAYNGQRPPGKFEEWPPPVIVWALSSSWDNLGIRGLGAYADAKTARDAVIGQLDAWIAALPGVVVIDLR